MHKWRSEWALFAVGLLIVAAVIVFRTVKTPSADYIPSLQDGTQLTTAEKSRYAVNINEATAQELSGVKYITEQIAKNIVTYRTENGRFYTEAQLMDVPGIGQATFDKILPYITLE